MLEILLCYVLWPLVRDVFGLIRMISAALFEDVVLATFVFFCCWYMCVFVCVCVCVSLYMIIGLSYMLSAGFVIW